MASNRAAITMEEMQEILRQEQSEYDMARIVNPYACCTMDLQEDRLTAQASCHDIWQHNHRCSNCFSKRACIQWKILYKTEVMGDKAYRIKTSPYRVEMEDGEERNLVIESIRISDLDKDEVNSRIDEELQLKSTQYVFNEVFTGVVHMDEDRNILFANRHAREMILRNGESESFILSTILSNWLEGRQDVENPSLTFTQRYEYDNKDFFFDVQLIPFDNNGKNELYIIMHEHDDQKAEELARSHDIDAFTGLYNEEGFCRTMKRILHQHPDREYLHIRVNVRNFTLIKGVFGVRTGDALITRLARVFENMTEETGCACRFYSDQFGMLIEKDYFDREKLIMELNRIKTDADSRNFGFLFTAGIYQIEDPDTEPEVICDRASMALRRVRENGDILASAVYTRDMTLEALVDNQTISNFERAILNDEFQIFLQPQVDGGGRLLGAEALVRWIRDDGEIIPPAYFIPQLEKNGMIYRMDEIVWEKAAEQLNKWKGTPFKDIRISVNISPVDITLVDIVEYFENITDRYEIEPQMLNIEITETAMVNQPELLLRIVDKLHRRGFWVEIDDFGSGYSSLKMLNDLNADVLKIDRGFLRQTIHMKRMKTILSSIINMAHELGMEVITEGVETTETLDMLTEMGGNIFQGFYFSKPLSVEEFEKKYIDSLR